MLLIRKPFYGRSPSMWSPNKDSRIPYRPHIDGLRCVAIIAVVLYHAKLFSVSAGFVGVDIFFVISGFLIAASILRDLDAGTFSLMGFWERRIRRIVPIFFVVVLSTIATAYFLMLYPLDYSYFGKTVSAQSTFTSNILFMVTDNYFDEHSQSAPLLHTWSLAVEEQFYVFIPLIVLFCAWLGARKKHGTTPEQNIRRPFFIIIALLGIFSLFLNIWFVNITPDLLFKVKSVPDWIFGGATYATVGFYFLLTRAWELILGMLLAISAIKIRSIALSEALSAGGVLAMIASIFLFTNSTPFPGFAALLPTLGAVMFIAANEHHSTRAGRMFSHPVPVFVGLISYSLYLWHWPLFVLAKLASPTPPSSYSMMGLCIIALLLSYLSYRFIEVPFRTKTFIRRRKVVFFMGATALSILALSGFLIEQYANPTSARIPAVAKKILEASSENVIWGGVCFQNAGDESRYSGLCRIGNPEKNAEPEFVVWGDSHAEAMVPLLNTLGQAYGIQGVVFDSGNCPPIVGTHQIPAAPGCENVKKAALRYIREHDIHRIILVARWSYYMTGGQNEKRSAIITDTDTIPSSPTEAQKVFERTLVPMVTQLLSEGRSVYIIEQIPEQFKFDLRSSFYRAVHSKKEIPFERVSQEESNALQALPNGVIRSLATLPNVHIINPAQLLCKNDGLCDLELRGKLIYRDESHLSTFGAMSLEPLFTPLFKSMQSSQANDAETR